MRYDGLFYPTIGTREKLFYLFDLIDERGKLWVDLEKVEKEMLDGNEDLVYWLHTELMEVYRAFKLAKGEQYR